MVAYSYDGVLGEGKIEKQHYWHLERLSRSAFDRGSYDAADEYLQRALKINERLGDEVFQLSTLNNLAATFGQKGDTNRAAKFLELAAPLATSYINEPTFPVDLIIDRSGTNAKPVIVERRRVEIPADPDALKGESTDARWIRRVHIPVKFSREFDENPDAVLGEGSDNDGRHRQLVRELRSSSSCTELRRPRRDRIFLVHSVCMRKSVILKAPFVTWNA